MPEPAAKAQGTLSGPSVWAEGNTAGRDFLIVQRNIYPPPVYQRMGMESGHQSVIGPRIRAIGAAGLGNLLGLAVAGLIAVISGKALAPGSHWLAGLPALVVLGAVAGPIAAWFTRRWLLPSWRRGARRTLLFTAAGSVVVPLAVAIGQLPEAAIRTVAIPLGLLGSAITLMLWTRTRRRTDSG
jgi:hypothetical protein